MADDSRVHLGHRLAGGFVALFGGLLLWSFATGDGGNPGDGWIFGVLGLAFALGGTWIVGLHRWFPRLDPFHTLIGAGLVVLGVFLAVLMVPAAFTAPRGGDDGPRWLGLVLPWPFILVGLGFLGAYRRQIEAIRASGLDPETLAGGTGALFAGTLMVALMLADGQGAMAIAGTPFMAAGAMILALTLRVDRPWWPLVQAVMVTLFLTGFAAAITAVAWLATPVAWPGALILVYVAWQGWAEVLRLARGLRKAP